MDNYIEYHIQASTKRRPAFYSYSNEEIYKVCTVNWEIARGQSSWVSFKTHMFPSSSCCSLATKRIKDAVMRLEDDIMKS